MITIVNTNFKYGLNQENKKISKGKIKDDDAQITIAQNPMSLVGGLTLLEKSARLHRPYPDQFRGNYPSKLNDWIRSTFNKGGGGVGQHV